MANQHAAGNEMVDRFARAVTGFSARVGKVSRDDLDRPTPCTEWTVGDLVNHVIGEMLWMPPLLEGQTIADVGDRFDGDQVGADPDAAWSAAADSASRAVVDSGDGQQLVHLSYGDVPAAGYITEVTLDVVVHTWDLASALGSDEQLDPDLVAFALDRLKGREAELAGSGLFAPPVAVEDDADAQTRLLAAVGRTPSRSS
jgi:uncharacterized protein (TIGR03086 family)